METIKHFTPALQVVFNGKDPGTGKDNYTAAMVINLPNHYYINDLPHLSVTNGSNGEVDVAITIRTTYLNTILGNNNNFMIRTVDFDVTSGAVGTVCTTLYYEDNGVTEQKKSKLVFKEY